MNWKSRIPEIQGGCQWKKLPGEWRLRRRRRQWKIGSCRLRPLAFGGECSRRRRKGVRVPCEGNRAWRREVRRRRVAATPTPEEEEASSPTPMMIPLLTPLFSSPQNCEMKLKSGFTQTQTIIFICCCQISTKDHSFLLRIWIRCKQVYSVKVSRFTNGVGIADNILVSDQIVPNI